MGFTFFRNRATIRSLLADRRDMRQEAISMRVLSRFVYVVTQMQCNVQRRTLLEFNVVCRFAQHSIFPSAVLPICHAQQSTLQ